MIVTFFYFADSCSFEGIFSLKAPLTRGYKYAEVFYMRNVPWKMYVQVKETNLENLCIYLHCYDVSTKYEHKAIVSFKLISSVDKKYDVTRTTKLHKFSSKDCLSYGPSNFVSIADLKDEKKGLMKNGIIRVKVCAIVFD